MSVVSNNINLKEINFLFPNFTGDVDDFTLRIHCYT